MSEKKILPLSGKPVLISPVLNPGPDLLPLVSEARTERSRKDRFLKLDLPDPRTQGLTPPKRLASLVLGVEYGWTLGFVPNDKNGISSALIAHALSLQIGVGLNVGSFHGALLGEVAGLSTLFIFMGESPYFIPPPFTFILSSAGPGARLLLGGQISDDLKIAFGARWSAQFNSAVPLHLFGGFVEFSADNEGMKSWGIHAFCLTSLKKNCLWNVGVFYSSRLFLP